ncbi:MAG: hypothetical protein LBB49_04185, partial [Gracilibacteraceae bacterium]|nr:hypothetical protein [Gracilibacteraceae bacterium]
EALQTERPSWAEELPLVEISPQTEEFSTQAQLQVDEAFDAGFPSQIEEALKTEIPLWTEEPPSFEISHQTEGTYQPEPWSQTEGTYQPEPWPQSETPLQPDIWFQPEAQLPPQFYQQPTAPAEMPTGTQNGPSLFADAPSTNQPGSNKSLLLIVGLALSILGMLLIVLVAIIIVNFSSLSQGYKVSLEDTQIQNQSLSSSQGKTRFAHSRGDSQELADLKTNRTATDGSTLQKVGIF